MSLKILIIFAPEKYSCLKKNSEIKFKLTYLVLTNSEYFFSESIFNITFDGITSVCGSGGSGSWMPQISD